MVYRQYFPVFRPGSAIPALLPVVVTDGVAQHYLIVGTAVFRRHQLAEGDLRVAYVSPGAEPIAQAWYDQVQSLVSRPIWAHQGGPCA